ncbi:MAG: TIM44-like domain-containing protein [Elusimicrobiota bacterium]|jgi:hypothetical protein|nr:TIM44-like domain-containing protein [Elusimicrobiota bacterium]
MIRKISKLLFISLALLLIYVCAPAQIYDNNLNDYLANRGAYVQPKKANSRKNNNIAYSHEFIYVVYAIIAGAISLIVFLLDKAEIKIFGKHAIERDLPGVIIDNTKEIITALHESDSNFNRDQFIEYAKEVFKTLKSAFSQRDISKLPLMIEEQYREHVTQISQYIKKKQINITGIENIDKAYLYKYDKTMEYEYLSAFLEVKMINYVIEELTKTVLQNDPDEVLLKKYLLVFRRDRVVLEPTKKHTVETITCPKCGAPALINNMGRCVYCDSVIKAGNYKWFLADIDIIWADSRYAPGGVFINNKQTERYK